MGLVVEVETSKEEVECPLCGNPWGVHWPLVAQAYVGVGVRFTSTEDLVMQVSMCRRCNPSDTTREVRVSEDACGRESEE